MNAIAIRDNAWQNTDLIPNWVRGREIGLDQFNTLPEAAEYCWNSLQKFLEKDKVILDNYKIIEPSAGTGSFYNLLPKKNRIGIDVEKYNKEYIQQDFLTWTPNIGDEPCIAIGNPPFGYRGWLALAFVNRASEFCDYVGFILPMSFQSDGKGSPKNRVTGMALVHSEKLPEDLFVLPNGERIQINTLWQIWKKGNAPALPDLSVCDSFVDLFTVDLRKERLCGMKKIDDCNLFLQRTYFGQHPKLVSNFLKVKYGCGYGILIKKEKRKITKILKNINWDKYSNLAAHNCRHISMYHIKQSL
ncbi:MAG: hypothetical protein AAB740_05500, partial [Patescibacteria group bacterium]